MKIRQKLKSAHRLVKEKNFAAIRAEIRLRRRRAREAKNYRRWLAANRIDDGARRKLRAETNAFELKPLISIVVPVYDIEENFLRRCIESVLRQIYENWQLCVADDCSPAPHVRRVLEEYARADRRIEVVFRDRNGHISAASNSALAVASGEWTALLDHDDELSEDALFQIVKEINDFPDAAFIYSDEDLIDERGERSQPKFKPDWSPDLFYSVNYVTHLAAYRTAILREIGGFRTGFEGSQDYDLALRVTHRIEERQIRHVPKILYHWRVAPGSVAHSADAKPYAHERARKALAEHFERSGKSAEIERGIYELHRVRYRLPANAPPVSLILWVNESIETAAAAALGITEATSYPNFEIVLVLDGDAAAMNHSAAENFKYIDRGNSSRAASLNRAVSVSAGEILCFADAGLCPRDRNWLAELTGLAMQKETGAVGGKILTRSETIGSGGGLVLGFGGLLSAANQNLPADADEGLYRTRVIGNFSAVSARCMATRREAFEKIGGFDAENLPQSLFDADFCLRLRQSFDLRTVFTPYAELIETGKSVAPPASAAESEFFRRKWRREIGGDPFYNPNLSLDGETFTIKI